jgi:hypothetical protein
MLDEITLIDCTDAAFSVLVASILILQVGGSVSNSLFVFSFHFYDKCFLKPECSSLFDAMMLRVGIVSMSDVIIY